MLPYHVYDVCSWYVEISYNPDPTAFPLTTRFIPLKRHFMFLTILNDLNDTPANYY